MPRLHDLRLAIRTLVRARFVSGLAIIAFALGIGVTTAVFSIFNSVLLEPFPFPESDRLVLIFDTQPACSTCPASLPKYQDWKTRNRVFSAIGGSMQASLVMTGKGDPLNVAAMATTASLADVFAVQPAIGRWYTEQEDRPGGPKVVVLTHGFWSQHLGADPAIVGRTVTFNGEPYEVLGVLPRSFTHRRAEVLVPIQRAVDPTQRGSHFLVTYGRLLPGIPLERARDEMRSLGRSLAVEFSHNHGIDVQSYYDVMVGSVRTPLTILLGAVFLVLVIACANVANLLLASGVARKRELAIRTALGARTRDLARQLTMESVLLALTGGAIGLLLAEWALQVFIVLAGNQLPRASTIQIDARVLLFSAIVSTGVGVFCGLWPLLLLRAKELAAAVREGDTRTISGAGRRFGNGLVVAEIAIAFALLVGAGLLVKNLVLLQQRDAGVRTEGIVAFDVQPRGPQYAQQPERQLAFYRDLYERLAAVGSVRSVGMTSHLPMYNFGWNSEYSIEGGNPWGPNDAPLVENRWMFGQYLETMGVPLLQGRLLDANDRKDSRTVLINSAMAAKFWPGQNPIGKRFGHEKEDRKNWFVVVGVIGDIRSFGLARATPSEFYRTIEQDVFQSLTVVIRTTTADPTAIVPTARRIVASIDPSVAISQVQTMEDVVAGSIGQPRLISALTALFGTLAGVLAMVGVYGVMAYNVRRQRREFGIRFALGADASSVKTLVVRRGLILAASGVAIGSIAAWFLTAVLKTMLNDVQPTDLTVFAGTAAAVLVVALLASYPPARSAGRVDAMVVLRES